MQISNEELVVWANEIPGLKHEPITAVEIQEHLISHHEELTTKNLLYLAHHQEEVDEEIIELMAKYFQNIGPIKTI